MHTHQHKTNITVLCVGLLLLLTGACVTLKNFPSSDDLASATKIYDTSTSKPYTHSGSISTFPPETPTNTPEPIDQVVVYREAFGIDYKNPNRYLVQGEQSIITNTRLIDHLHGREHGIDHLALVYHWLQNEFTNYSARGATIGAITADQLLENRQLGGCHDFGLLFVAVARELGYPAVMIDSYSIAWIEAYQNGTTKGHIGHVFVELFMEDKWVLVDPTNGWYVENGYDPSNPIIPLQVSIAGSSTERYGFYVDLKGLDSWSYGVHNNKDLTERMDKCASDLDLSLLTYPDYTFQRFD